MPVKDAFQQHNFFHTFSYNFLIYLIAGVCIALKIIPE